MRRGTSHPDLEIPATNKMMYFLLQVNNRKNDTMLSVLKAEARNSLREVAKLMPSTSTAHLLRNQANAVSVYPDEKNKHNQMLRSSTKRQNKDKNRGKGKGKGNGKVYNFNDMHRVVVLAVGMSSYLYSGLVYPPEEDTTTNRHQQPASKH